MAFSTRERGKRKSVRAAERAASPLDFVGQMSAFVAILPVSLEAARAMLPAGLGLATQDATPGDRHPLMLIMGQQRDVRPRLLPIGADYLEFILAVPFVEHQSGGPFCYCPRLLLDRRLPIVAGRLLYGYDKRPAAIRMTEDSYRVADRGSAETLIEAHVRAVEPAIEPARAAASLFALPVISQAGSGWRYSFADSGLDRAVVQPIELHLAIRRAFVSGLPLGEFLIGRGADDGARAFRLRTRWRLAGPWARRSLP
jgi:Acetoacetate decarboxylase (ADC)